MQQHINKLVTDMLEDWIQQNTQGIITTTEDGCSRITMLEYIQAKKKLINLLHQQGLDPFKRGTKEPERIKESLTHITKEQFESTTEAPNVRSMFD